MREPNFLTRLSGFWPTTIFLFACYGLVIYAWTQGRTGLIPAMLALGFFCNTVRAAWYMHRYRRWAKEWHRAGEMDSAEPTRKRGRVKALLRIAAVFVMVGVPLLIGGRGVRNQFHVDDLRMLWAAVFVYVVAVLAFRLLRGGMDDLYADDFAEIRPL